jgi:UDP-3-O-[3-hydroxymyristoyl] glucosamine N-acyltransferase
MKRDIGKKSATEIAALLGLEFAGPDVAVSGVSPFPPTDKNVLCFSGTAGGGADALPAGCIVIAQASARDALLRAGATVISSTNPKYDFCRLFALLAPPANWGVHPAAHIGPHVNLSDRVAIGPGCVLEGDIHIGGGTRIGANVVLKNSVVIGENVSMRNGSVIGEDAFSFGFSDPNHASAKATRFPCFGGVVISDYVEIGNNCVISRGTFGDTILGQRARVNDMAHIGNEVQIGERSTIMAHTDISARVRIGTGVQVCQSAAIRQGLKIGDSAIVGMGAVVTKDVAAGTVVMGVPARVARER